MIFILAILLFTISPSPFWLRVGRPVGASPTIHVCTLVVNPPHTVAESTVGIIGAILEGVPLVTRIQAGMFVRGRHKARIATAVHIMVKELCSEKQVCLPGTLQNEQNAGHFE